MIPKIIHYCWFGKNEYPEKINRCLESWKTLEHDYQFMLWNEESFDVEAFDFAREAYHAGKYAFVSDMVRFYVLSQYGGIYLDTDIEVVRDFSEILDNNVVLSGDESGNLDGAFIAGIKGHPFFREMFEKYKDMCFFRNDGTQNQTVINVWMQETLKKYGYRHANESVVLKEDVHVFPVEYFCAMDQYTGRISKTEKTFCVHHHTYLWTSKKTNVLRFFRTKIIVPVIGARSYAAVSKRLHKILKHKNYEG